MYYKSRFMKNAAAKAAAVALVFIPFFVLAGCSEVIGSSPDLLELTEEEKAEAAAVEAAEKLAGALGAGKATHTSGTTVVTITADTDVAETIPSRVTLSIPQDITVTVPGDKTLTVAANAKVEVSGDLIVAGDLAVAANGEVEVKSGGVFFLDGAGGGDNGSLAGTIRIKSGAKSYSTGRFTGNGWTVIEAGGAAYAEQSPNASSAATIGGTDAVFNLTSGTFALNAGGYVLDGAAAEEAVTRQDGVEITVKLENGEYLAIVQADDGENFQRGERVRLVDGGQATRVTRAAPARD